MTPDVSVLMTDALVFDDGDLDDDVPFSEDEEAALLVALLRWRGRTTSSTNISS